MALRSFAALSLLLSAAAAQSNPFIPPTISTSCTTYLTALNNNSALAACTGPFTTALAAFAPGSPSSAAPNVSTALGALCAANTFSACPQSTVCAQLSSFYAACSAELTSAPNKAVQTTYDVLYSLVPVRQAICCKDDSGSYCATKLSNASAPGEVALVDPQKSQKQSLLSQYLYTSPDGAAPARRALSNSTSALVPNTTTYDDTNLLFLFLEPSMSSAALCTTCTRNIMTPYISFESSCPYAPGLNNSLLLAGQVPLYNNITSKCGSSFLSGAVQAAGGLSSGLLSGAAPLAPGKELSAALGAILGVAAFVAASL